MHVRTSHKVACPDSIIRRGSPVIATVIDIIRNGIADSETGSRQENSTGVLHGHPIGKRIGTAIAKVHNIRAIRSRDEG